MNEENAKLCIAFALVTKDYVLLDRLEETFEGLIFECMA
jgi:hypothetical protein